MLKVLQFYSLLSCLKRDREGETLSKYTTKMWSIFYPSPRVKINISLIDLGSEFLKQISEYTLESYIDLLFLNSFFIITFKLLTLF